MGLAHDVGIVPWGEPGHSRDDTQRLDIHLEAQGGRYEQVWKPACSKRWGKL